MRLWLRLPVTFAVVVCLTALLTPPVHSQSRWVRLAPFPEPAEELYGATINGEMYVLGQVGDPDQPDRLLELQYSSGRYFTLVYSTSGTLQRERGYTSLPDATRAFGQIVDAIIDGRLDPAQPVFREDLED